MRIIRAKFHCHCAETGRPIRKGETCLYGYGKVYAETSETYKNYMTDTRQEAAAEAEARSTGAMIEAEQNVYYDNFSQRNQY